MTRAAPILLAVLIGYCLATVGGAHAAPDTTDRALVERLVRAVEALTRATERRCK